MKNMLFSIIPKTLTVVLCFHMHALAVLQILLMAGKSSTTIQSVAQFMLWSNPNDEQILWNSPKCCCSVGSMEGIFSLFWVGAKVTAVLDSEF